VTRPPRVLAVGALAGAVGWATTHGIDGGTFFMAPALLLALPLLFGRYVGEERILALMAPRRRAPQRRPPKRIDFPRRPRTLRRRAGELIARSLAVRPPPHLRTA